MKIRLSLVYVLIFIYGSFSGCSLKTVETIETGDKNSRKNTVLIVTQKSKFKRAVVDGIKNALEDDVPYIKVVDVKWLPNESTDNYSAIVIINRCMAGRPDPRIESFIDNYENKEKVILLTTGQLDSWKPDSSKVDAMTSASNMSESDRVARTISNKVLTIINTH